MLNKPIIIVGMHRSGTSMVCRILQDHGLFLGRDQEKNNESRFFLNMNRWILEQSGGRWDNPSSVTSILSEPSIRPLFSESLNTLIDSHRRSGFMGIRNLVRYGSLKSMPAPWGWKDPRNTITLPLWLDLFPEAKIINITRHGVDVANSLYVRNSKILARHLPINKKDIVKLFGYKTHIIKIRSGLSTKCSSMDGAFSLWLEYMRFSESIAAGLGENLLSIKYEDLLATPAIHITRLIEFCGLGNKLKIASDANAINPRRAYAFENNEELKQFAKFHQSTLREHGY